jgi:hypothetical protein
MRTVSSGDQAAYAQILCIIQVTQRYVPHIRRPGSREWLAIDVETWVLAPDTFWASHTGYGDCSLLAPQLASANTPAWFVTPLNMAFAECPSEERITRRVQEGADRTARTIENQEDKIGQLRDVPPR